MYRKLLWLIIAIAFCGHSSAYAYVYGIDNRSLVCPTCGSKPTQVPYATMGKVWAYFPDGTVGRGSGTMISRHHMLTAAHVVYQGDHGGMAYQIKFEPQRYGAIPKYTAYGSIPLTYVPNTFKQNNPGVATNFVSDYALVNLDRPIGQVTGWMDVEAYDSYLQTYPQPSGSFPLLNIAGYPGDRPNPGSTAVPKETALYVSGGEVDQVTSDFLRFEPEDECTGGTFGYCLGADWAAGQSGGAIWIHDIRDTQRHLIGLVSFEQLPSGYNNGLKITNSILSTLANRMNTSILPGYGIVGGNATSDAPPNLPDLADYDILYGTTNNVAPTTSLRVNETLSASIGVANTGTVASSSVPVSFYLSSDTTINSSDVLIGSTNLAPIAAFASATLSFSASIPHASPGQYYLGWIIDASNSLLEYVESDNFGVARNSIQISPILGDYNANGTVDAADYTVWRDAIGQSGPGLTADGNGDNLIDSSDYDIWRSHFGQTALSGEGAAVSLAIPEPATAALLSLAILIMYSWPTDR
jgi:V8-like Glu-specific endopeptidase